MADMNIISKIQTLFYTLPPAEQRVANEIMSDVEKAQHVSISELAESAKVADATVTRLCKRLSLSGFYALKIELAKVSHSQEKHNAQKANGTSSLVSESVSDGIFAIKTAAESISTECIEKVARLIQSAERVLCVGTGGGSLTASECAHLFSLSTNKFTTIQDLHMQISALCGMKRGDILLLFSYSGATKSGLEILAVAKEMGIHTVLISAFHKSPLASECDEVLVCGATEAPNENGSVGARMAMLTVIDILYRAYVSETGKPSCEYRDRINNAIAKRHL